MCCTNRAVWEVDTTANITGENGTAYPMPKSIQQFISDKPQGTFWVERNIFGQPILAGFLEAGSDLTLQWGTGTSTKNAPAILIGGHPSQTRPGTI